MHAIANIELTFNGQREFGLCLSDGVLSLQNVDARLFGLDIGEAQFASRRRRFDSQRG